MFQQHTTTSMLLLTFSTSSQSIKAALSSSPVNPMQASISPIWRCWLTPTTISEKEARLTCRVSSSATEWWTSGLSASTLTTTWLIVDSLTLKSYLSSRAPAKLIANLQVAVTLRSNTEKVLKNLTLTVNYHLYRCLRVLLLQWLFRRFSKGREKALHFPGKHSTWNKEGVR